MNASDTTLSGPTKYCLGCSYALDGLPENRCPECGRPFDPDESRTFSPRPRAKKKATIVVLMYLLPLLVSLTWWASLASNLAWVGGTPALQWRLLIGLWQACGPLAWVMLETGATHSAAILAIFSVSWALWLTVVCNTRLRQLPYPLHLAFGFLWCFAGCPPAGLAVT